MHHSPTEPRRSSFTQILFTRHDQSASLPQRFGKVFMSNEIKPGKTPNADSNCSPLAGVSSTIALREQGWVEDQFEEVDAAVRRFYQNGLAQKLHEIEAEVANAAAESGPQQFKKRGSFKTIFEHKFTLESYRPIEDRNTYLGLKRPWASTWARLPEVAGGASGENAFLGYAFGTFLTGGIVGALTSLVEGATLAAIFTAGGAGIAAALPFVFLVPLVLGRKKSLRLQEAQISLFPALLALRNEVDKIGYDFRVFLRSSPDDLRTLTLLVQVRYTERVYLNRLS